MNYKELQNRKYLFQLLINLNSNLKGLLKEELLDVNNMDYIIHTLIDSKFGISRLRVSKILKNNNCEIRKRS